MQKFFKVENGEENFSDLVFKNIRTFFGGNPFFWAINLPDTKDFKQIKNAKRFFCLIFLDFYVQLVSKQPTRLQPSRSQTTFASSYLYLVSTITKVPSSIACLIYWKCQILQLFVFLHCSFSISANTTCSLLSKRVPIKQFLLLRAF